MKVLLSSCLVLLLNVTGFGQTVYISGHVNASHMDSISGFVYTLFQQKDAKKIKLQFADYSGKKGDEEPLTISLKKKMKHSVELDKLFNKYIDKANDNATIPFKAKRLVNLQNEVRIKNTVKNLAILDKCGVLSSDNEVKSVIASSIPELLSVNAKAKVYLLSFYEPSAHLSNLSMDGQNIVDVSKEILTTNNTVELSGRISTDNSTIKSVTINVNGKDYDVPISSGINQVDFRKQLYLNNNQLNTLIVTAVYAGNGRFEQLLNIRILHENQVIWLNPKPNGNILVTCVNQEDSKQEEPLLVFNFQTMLPVSKLTLHIDDISEVSHFKGEFKIGNFIREDLETIGENKNFCLILHSTTAMAGVRKLGDDYFPCQFEHKMFSLYFTYGDKGGPQYQVSKKLLNVEIVDKDVDPNTNDDELGGRIECFNCE